jgi:hypothetical protein
MPNTSFCRHDPSGHRLRQLCRPNDPNKGSTRMYSEGSSRMYSVFWSSRRLGNENLEFIPAI